MSFYTPSNVMVLPGGGQVRIDDARCFYPNKCHICHIPGAEGAPLKRCSRCNLMYYCGRDHQLADWKDHKDICKVLKALGGPKILASLKDLQDPINASLDTKFRLSRKRSQVKSMAFMQVGSQLDRACFFFEKEMIMHPRLCIVCYESDPGLLRSCPDCPQASFCDEHKDDPSHSRICQMFRRSCINDMADIKLKKRLPTELLNSVTFPLQKTGSRLPYSMEDFIANKDFITVNKSATQEELFSKDLWEIYLSDLLCPVLTVLHALEKLEFSASSNLTIHVLGANVKETLHAMWELIPHWLPAVKNFNISFIGPETEGIPGNPKIELCSTCERRKIQVNTHVTSEFYQDFMRKSTYKQPNLIVAYNAGFLAYPSWYPFLSQMASLHCPFIQTSFTELEAHQDYQMIKSINSKANHLYFGPNPFASFISERSVEDEKPFLYSEFLTIFDTA